MNKIRISLMLLGILSTQAAFAYVARDASKDPTCAAIAKACSAAGFERTETAGKQLWQDCMNPILLSKTVKGLTVDPGIVKNCRFHKIEELKMELKDLQNAASKSSS